MSGETEAFLAAVGEGTPDASVVAAAFGRHLGGIAAGQLPADAQAHWREVARLLKSSPDAPVPQRAMAGMRSWPLARVGELIRHVRDMAAVLDRIENDRWEDEIRDKIRHTYL